MTVTPLLPASFDNTLVEVPSLAASAGASAATRSNVRFGVRRIVLRLRRSLPVYPDEQTCGRPAGQAPCSAGSAPTNSNSVLVSLKENRVQSLSQILYGHRIRWNQLRSQVRGKRFDHLSARMSAASTSSSLRPS